MPRNRHKNLARAIAHQAEKNADIRLAKKIEVAMSGCSERTLKALIELPRVKEECNGSACIPDVALFRAGHRGKTKSIYQAR
ncbi:MAG: hypothetical protein ACMZI0_15035 [Symbiopectobacterium sp.]|uniref:transcriptional antitermination N peptide n=1 Tax=Symbiopectobacterium sp. TaxID=2952789 RepID=UPI0039EC9FDE